MSISCVNIKVRMWRLCYIVRPAKARRTCALYSCGLASNLADTRRSARRYPTSTSRPAVPTSAAWYPNRNEPEGRSRKCIDFECMESALIWGGTSSAVDFMT